MGRVLAFGLMSVKTPHAIHGPGICFKFLVADKRVYTLLCRSVGRSVGPSVTFLNSKRFLHYCSCPTVRDWTAVYPALFLIHQNLHCSFLFDTAGTTRTSSEANKTAARRESDVTKRSSASKASASASVLDWGGLEPKLPEQGGVPGV